MNQTSSSTKFNGTLDNSLIIGSVY